jgi:hypothetical protein
MKRLGIIGIAAAAAALTGCGRQTDEERYLSKMAHCAEAAELHAAALERAERLQQQPDKYTATRAEGVTPAVTASKRYVLLACGFDTSIFNQ